MSRGFIELSGVAVPFPDYGSGKQTTSTTVNGGFNALNVFIGQRVGRDRTKMELSLGELDAGLWSELCQKFKVGFVNSVRYYDMVEGRIITRKFYVNDRSALPDKVNEQGEWITAKDCSFNVIDTGEGV
ncbi:MAG: hypothetical protein RSF40_07370 [Oscillospiraceae bacterium]